MNANRSAPTVAPQLGLWDTVSIIVGIVVGTAIFKSPTVVFQNAGGPTMALALWVVGGVLAWCGAVCYAELATTYPRDGGDYEYLNRAFGTWCGFLFAWTQLTTVISGNIAIMAYAFGDYAARLWPAVGNYSIWVVIAPVIVLSALNSLGVVAGKIMQNLLTATKVIGMAALVVAGLWASSTKPPLGHELGAESQVVANPGIPASRIGLALVFVLYAYGGWSHAAFVAAEVRDQRRNLPRALVLGITGIALIYFLVNATYLLALGFDGARTSPTPAAEVLERVVGPWGGRAISLLVMLSALGAINGMILTGTRVYATWGADYTGLAWLSRWNRGAAPIAAIAAQAAIALLLIVLVGTTMGRNAFDAALRAVGLRGLPWQEYYGGFEALVAGSTPVYWALSLLTGLAVFTLRFKDRAIERPFTIPLFPVPAVLFCATCAYMLYASAVYARWLILLAVVPLIIGCGLAFVMPRREKNR
jgi:APA family basic amino acid/polyamine antiporter